MATNYSSGDFGNVLKTLYDDAIHSQIIESSVILDVIEAAGADDIELGGGFNSGGTNIGGFTFVPKLTLSGGAGWTAESGKVAASGTFKATQGHADGKEVYGRIKLTNKEMAASRKAPMAFATAMEYKTDSIVAELRRITNIAMYGASFDFGDGTGTTRWPTGILGQQSGAIAGTTVTVTGGTPQHFYPNQRLLFVTEAELEGGTAHSAGARGTVASVAISAAGGVTVVLTGVTGVPTANDYIVPGDDTATDGDWLDFNNAPFGLEHICANGTDDDLFGVDTSDFPIWAASNKANAGVLTRPQLNGWTRAVHDVSSQMPLCLIGHGTAQEAVQETMDPELRYMETVKFTGGFDRSALMWLVGNTKVPVMADYFAPLQKLYSLPKESIKLGYMADWGWVEQGDKLVRVANTVDFDAIYGAILNTVVFKRNAVGRLSGISVDFTSVALGA